MRGDADARHDLHRGEQRDAGEVLELADRRDHHVDEVARPGLLHEARRQPDAGLVDDVPQHGAAEDVADDDLAATFDSRDAYTASVPNSMMSTSGHSVTSNRRCGLRLRAT